MVEIVKNRWGAVSWTLKDGKWVRPGTNAVDTRPPPGFDPAVCYL